MATEPVVEKSPALKNGVWQERLKVKDFYHKMRFQRRKLGRKYNLQIYAIIIALIGLLLSIIMLLMTFFTIIIMNREDGGDQPDLVPIIMGIGGLLGMFITGFIADMIYGKAKKTKVEIQPYTFLGLLSQQLAEECSHLDLFVDFRDTTKTTPYKMRKSPYSGAKKKYYNHHWLRIATISLDGIKFVMSSRRKIKTKGSIRRMDITSYTFRFSFGIAQDEKLTGNRLKDLEKIISEKTIVRFQGMFASKAAKIDYPAAGAVRFTLKIAGNSREITPIGVMESLGEFSEAIHDSYPDYTGFELQPLKQLNQARNTLKG